MNEPVYAGFWVRVGAALIDSLLLVMVLLPLGRLLYGPQFYQMGHMGSSNLLLNYFLPAVAVLLFWIYRSATPGKIILDLEIVDADTGGKPSNAQFVGRYLSYYLSAIPFLLGIIWVAFDRRKQGWHDKLAGTLVIRRRRSGQDRFGPRE